MNFTRRTLETDRSLGAKMERIQYSNRVKVRPIENKLGRFIGIVFLTVTFILILIGNFAKPPVIAEELPIQVQAIEEDLTLVDTPWRTVPKLENGSPEQNEKLAYAYKISGYSRDFIYVLNGENGLWTHDRIHDSSANTIGTDMGFGINSYFHPEIVNDPKFWNDWRWNIDRTFQLWDSGVKFYGYSKNGII